MILDSSKNPCIALISAAGKGSRMNLDINKQYIKIKGIPILARTIKKFQECDQIDEIILIVNEKDIVFCKESIVDFFGFSKVKKIVSGGSQRYISVYNGLKSINESQSIVVVHDGVRPFVSLDTIKNCIAACKNYGSAVAGVKVKDTIKKSDPENNIEETIDRKFIWTIQTPQVFKCDLLSMAYEKAFKEGFTGTDDSSYVERIGIYPKLVHGGYENIKITTQEDLIFAEAILDKESK